MWSIMSIKALEILVRSEEAALARGQARGLIDAWGQARGLITYHPRYYFTLDEALTRAAPARLSLPSCLSVKLSPKRCAIFFCPHVLIASSTCAYHSSEYLLYANFSQFPFLSLSFYLTLSLFLYLSLSISIYKYVSLFSHTPSFFLFLLHHSLVIKV